MPLCVNYDVRLEVRENFNESFPIFKFPDTCLKQIIEKLCTTPFLVPNIIHYIWLGKDKFDFMYFVSILSGYKKQHPCLIFLYYDTLPSGQWWNLLLLYVPNIIPVNVTPPSEIANKKILYVQHKSDILRLQILKGMIVRLYHVKWYELFRWPFFADISWHWSSTVLVHWNIIQTFKKSLMYWSIHFKQSNEFRRYLWKTKLFP